MARSCGSLKAFYTDVDGSRQYAEAGNIKEAHVICGEARRIARDWGVNEAELQVSGENGDPPLLSDIDGFRCRYHRAGSDIGSTVCRQGRTVVSFGHYDSSPFH